MSAAERSIVFQGAFVYVASVRIIVFCVEITTMSHEENGMAKGLVVGFIAGSVVGAVVGLLLAPKSGREIRADLKAKADEFSDEAQVYLTKARAKASELIDEGKKRSGEVMTDARKKADTLLGDAEKILTDARTRVSGESGKRS